MKLPYEFSDVSPPLAEADVAEFEKELGYLLPADYRSFLLEVNGGHPANECYEYGAGRGFVLQRLYPLSHDERGFDLRSQNLSRRSYPKELLIIGRSICGDKVCLGIGGKHRGQVFWIDHEKRDPDRAKRYPWLGIEQLCSSFGEFMKSLIRI